MKIISVVGARPNFMKIAPFIAQIKKFNQKNNEDPIQHILVHTGQHYDIHLSKRFFKELNIPKPKYSLNIRSGTHADQTARAMQKLEPIPTISETDMLKIYPYGIKNPARRNARAVENIAGNAYGICVRTWSI